VPHSTKAPLVDYAAELMLLKNEIKELRNVLTTTVEHIKTEIASICTAPMLTMETDEANSENTTTDFPAIIADLKHDIATIAIEMREKFNELRACPQLIPFQLTPFPT